MLLPAATARFWARSVGTLILIAFLTSAASSLLGLLASFHFSVPSGPAIILTAGLLYLISLFIGREGGWISSNSKNPKVTQ